MELTLQITIITHETHQHIKCQKDFPDISLWIVVTEPNR